MGYIVYCKETGKFATSSMKAAYIKDKKSRLRFQGCGIYEVILCVLKFLGKK